MKDHEWSSDLICPHCGHVYHDAWELMDESGETECGECGRTYAWERHIMVRFSSKAKATHEQRRH